MSFNSPPHPRGDELRGLLKQAAMFVVGKPSIGDLAMILGVTPQHLYAQAATGEITPKIAKKIEILTDGRISRQTLNPTIFG
jgi:DNA-binding transcriptional regulator YdaS (Cro superfamily)